MEDIKEYLVTEFIEEYEDGALDRLSLERRLVGILGPDRAVRLLEDVPGPSTPPAFSAGPDHGGRGTGRLRRARSA